MNQLPNTPSDLIRTAIADLIKAEASPFYSINMQDWHVPKEEVCEVCLAGAVMAFSLDAPPHKNIDPYEFDRELANKLRALNAFREGSVWLGLNQLDISFSYKVPERVRITSYREDPEQFKADIFGLAELLKVFGL